MKLKYNFVTNEVAGKIVAVAVGDAKEGDGLLIHACVAENAEGDGHFKGR